MSLLPKIMPIFFSFFKKCSYVPGTVENTLPVLTHKSPEAGTVTISFLVTVSRRREIKRLILGRTAGKRLV